VEGQAIEDLVLGDMGIGDLEEVVGIERASCTQPWSETLFFNEIHNPRSMPRVARKKGKVAGYLCAGLIMDEGHILNLAVRPGMRRTGIASLLIGDVIDRLREKGCRVLFLEVRDSNTTARKIYGKFGFKVIGIRKNYYVSPDEDAIIMSMRLDVP
jgi:[ribosomal protein S18]-alanine N-acetyltransferase